jgi:hypothetical protein
LHFLLNYSPNDINAVLPPSSSRSYVAGEWADIESCHHLFQPDGTPRTVKKTNFPRSQGFSPRQQPPPNGVWDVVIVGAGCIGACVARELSRSQLHVLLVDSADDVTQGATKGNSGIVHAGYDDKPGTNRAKYCWKGNQMFAALDDDLHFGFQRNGSLVIALNEKEEEELQNLLQRGAKNGVQNLRILSREEVSLQMQPQRKHHFTLLFKVFLMEPAINPATRAALYSPDAGNIIPYTPIEPPLSAYIHSSSPGTSSPSLLQKTRWITACLCAFDAKSPPSAMTTVTEAHSLCKWTIGSPLHISTPNPMIRLLRL